MENSHTPAPWTHQSEPYEDGMPYSYIFSGNERTPANFKRHEIYISGIMKEADGRLIAAAPDMYKALKAWDKWERRDNTGEPYPDIYEVYQLLRDAIAKVETV